MGTIPERLDQMAREMERAAAPAPSRRPSSRGVSRRPAVALLVFSLLGLIGGGTAGFSVGRELALQAWSRRQPSESQQRLRQGWKHDGTGVFYRWCARECHAPRLVGGGISEVFEVACVERPCGTLSVRLEVMNARGEVIDRHQIAESGLLRGEVRRFLVESERSDASGFQMREFSARTRL